MSSVTDSSSPGASSNARARPPLASFESGWKAPVFLPNPCLSFPAVFGRRVESSPGATAFTVVKASGRDLRERAFSYEKLARKARRAALRLQAAGVTEGDRVILSIAFPDGFFVWFLACQALGAIPVPLPPASEYQMPAAFRDRIRNVAGDCSPRAVAADSPSAWTDTTADYLPGVVTLDAETKLEESDASVPERFSFERSLDEPAFIQYTSGSTGEPKGVVVDHYNLIANFRAIAEGAAFGPDDRSFSWLPVFHDMGLIGGFLLGVYMNTATFVMAPRYFVLRPDSWLHGCARYRATFTVAPNFAYSLVARRLPDSSLEGLDLSSMRLAFDGAEPIDRETVEAFVRRLAPFGFRSEAFYPVYGLAECTLAVAFPDVGTEVSYETVERRPLSDERRAILPRSENPRDIVDVVSVGQAVPGHRVRILAVDRDEELPDRHVGEVAVTGPSVTRGYWGKPERSADELRTGDLGYLSNGELYVVDRLKDLVIIAGRNLVPTDVERVLGEIDGLLRGSIAVFGVAGAQGTEELVVVAAIEPRTWRSLDEIREDVRRRVSEYFAVQVTDICIVAPGSIPKTSSGKIQRLACRKSYQARTLPSAEGFVARAEIKVRHAQRRVATMLSAKRVSDFPPAAEDTLPPASGGSSPPDS
jgi:fatty-acyl-CoA synthase